MEREVYSFPENDTLDTSTNGWNSPAHTSHTTWFPHCIILLFCPRRQVSITLHETFEGVSSVCVCVCFHVKTGCLCVYQDDRDKRFLAVFKTKLLTYGSVCYHARAGEQNMLRADQTKEKWLYGYWAWEKRLRMKLVVKCQLLGYLSCRSWWWIIQCKVGVFTPPAPRGLSLVFFQTGLYLHGE